MATGVDTATFGTTAHPSPFDGHATVTVTIPAGASDEAHALAVTTGTGTVVTVG